jgi:hypothetical protein
VRVKVLVYRVDGLGEIRSCSGTMVVWWWAMGRARAGGLSKLNAEELGDGEMNPTQRWQ